MEQGRSGIVKYSPVQESYRGFVIDAWAQKDERLPAYYGNARWYRAEENAPSHSLGSGLRKACDDSREATEWALQHAKRLIDEAEAG
ncbi:hypothetical protein V8Z80_08245 [Orrella sp. JC864]|uniref:hypothetical protein n=1 Tax=Orrella sp. JC864 TaxID=3120298 RepID=UPI0030099FCF